MIAETISHYRILQKLGQGGMGEVYLAEDTQLRRKVALKLLSRDLTKNADRLRRFEQEAQAASALNHPRQASFIVT
jgi:serine/threonine protein kinase